MAKVSLSHIYKIYDRSVTAVRDFSMEIDDGEFIVFVGPSGCGKSTTLRMIAGLEEITSGELKIDGVTVNDMEPKDRSIAMVFQNYALYPHMTVFENMAFALTTAHVPKNEIKEKVSEAARILGITEYLDRKPKALSGGQRQRVALGRAIVRHPKVFLLDEPLSNLDAKLRGAMRAEILRLHERLGATFIYVTHDQVEAMTMGTRIVVMKDGVIQQIAAPSELYKDPCNIFVAGFIGTPQMNFFDCTLLRHGETITILLACGVELVTEYRFFDKISEKYSDGKHALVIGIRPDDIKISSEELEEKQFIKANCTVKLVEDMGSEAYVHAELDSSNGQAPFTLKHVGECGLKRGDELLVSIKAVAIYVFDKESGKNIKPSIVCENTIFCSISDGVLYFDNMSQSLPSALSGIEAERAEISFSPDSLTLGVGECTATVASVNEDGELCKLKTETLTLFARKKEPFNYSVGQKVRFEIDPCGIKCSDPCITPPDSVNKISASLVRVKETSGRQKRYSYFFQCTTQRLPADAEKCKKLYLSHGIKILGTPLNLVFRSSDVLINKENTASCLRAIVTRVLDYGKIRYVTARIGEDDITLRYDAEPGDVLCIHIPDEALGVEDKKSGITII